MSEIVVRTEQIDLAFAKVLVTSKRDAPQVMETAMRGAMRQLIDITPPGHEGVRGGKARQHGAALVKSDIRSIYGTPRQAFKEMEQRDEFMAKQFWRHHKRGENDRASGLAQEVIGKGLFAFDGGKAHQNLKRGRPRGRSRRILIYTFDEAALTAYIRQIQARVGWLAAGWNEAAALLGIKPQEWIWRHPAPGAMRIEVNDISFRITATNAVRFASEAADMQRRVQWAVNAQAAAMLRTYDNFIRTKFVAAGFLGTPSFH